MSQNKNIKLKIEDPATLSEDIIRKNLNDYWSYLSQFATLSEDFIREFKDNVDWALISKYQILSEDFIREFEDKVDWKLILRYQSLSKEFIREFKKKVNACYGSLISSDLIRRYIIKNEYQDIEFMVGSSTKNNDTGNDLKNMYIDLHVKYDELFEKYRRLFYDTVNEVGRRLAKKLQWDTEYEHKIVFEDDITKVITELLKEYLKK